MADKLNGTSEAADQRLLEVYKEISQHAKSEVSWVRSAYALAATLAAFVGSVGIFFTYKSSSDFRNETRQEIERQEQQMINRLTTSSLRMQENLNQQVLKLGHVVESRVEEEFKQENIKALVEQKARARIDQIADPLITKHISENIMPHIKTAENQLQQINTELKDARDTIADLSANSEFTTTVITAQNDDRISFDKLKSWADDPTFPRRKDALQAWIKVLDDHASPFTSSYSVPWKEGFDPSELSLVELKAQFILAPTFIKLGLLEYIWNRKDFRKGEKMQFLADVIWKEKSLKVVETAGRFFTTESKQKIKPLAVEQLMDWWNKNKDQIDK